MKKNYLIIVFTFLMLVLFTVLVSAVEINQYTWETRQGTFKLNERIAKKVANGETLKIYVSSWGITCPFNLDVIAGAKKYSEEVNGKFVTEMIGPVDTDCEKQIAQLETLIDSESVDGLLCATADPSSVINIYEKAFEAGIPLVVHDADSVDSKRLCFVGVSHEDVGKTSAKAIVEQFHKKTGKLAYTAESPEGLYARERFKGLFDQFEKEDCKFDIIGPFKFGLDLSIAYGVMEDIMLANPDIDIIYVADEWVTVAGEYVKRNDAKDDILVFGVNTTPEVLLQVKEGYIVHTVDINPFGQGYMGIKILYDFITQGKIANEFIMIEPTSVTKENIDEWLKK